MTALVIYLVYFFLATRHPANPAKIKLNWIVFEPGEEPLWFSPAKRRMGESKWRQLFVELSRQYERQAAHKPLRLQ